MRRKIELGFLATLIVVIGVLLYTHYAPSSEAPDAAIAIQKFQPIAVENPALRTDLLVNLKKLEYEGTHRNIFSVKAPPPPAPPVEAAPAPPPGPVVPPPPPPLTVPATFFGYVTDARTGTRRAFFSEGDDVFVVGVGDLLAGRFRLIEIGNSTAELEENGSGRRTTVTLQEQGPS